MNPDETHERPEPYLGGVQELRDELVLRAARLAPALKGLASDLADARTEIAKLKRENTMLRRQLAQQQHDARASTHAWRG